MAGDAAESGFAAVAAEAAAAPETAKMGARRRVTPDPSARAAASPAAAAAATNPSVSPPANAGGPMPYAGDAERGPQAAAAAATDATVGRVRRRTQALEAKKGGDAGPAAAGSRGAAAAAAEASRDLCAASVAPAAPKSPEKAGTAAAAAPGRDAGGGGGAAASKARARQTAAAAATRKPTASRAPKAAEAPSARPVEEEAGAADEGHRQQQQQPYTAGAPPRTRAPPAAAIGQQRGGRAAAAAAVAPDVGESEKRLCITCSKCGLGVEEVLLLSCHHHLCLLCAAAAAQASTQQAVALQQTYEDEAEADEEARPTADGQQQSSRSSSPTAEMLLRCPLCKASTVLSASATAAVRRQLHFFENPPGCCFDAGPVASATSGVVERGRGRSEQEQQAPLVALCSQCERQAAAVYCRSCVRRYCGACAVEVHQDHPRLLAHPFQLLHQQQQQRREASLEEMQVQGEEAAAELPPVRAAALQQAVQHMRTVEDDCASFLSSSLHSSRGSLARRGRRGRKEEEEEKRRGGRGPGPAGDEEPEADSVHSSAIRVGLGEEGLRSEAGGGAPAEGGRGRAASFEGVGLLHHLRQVLAAVPLSAAERLSSEGAAAAADFRAAARWGVSAELLQLRTVTNVACYAHASQPVEFFCCTCECYCLCAYCLTGFFPSGSTAAQAGAGAGYAAARSEDHTGHFLQAVDAAWRETVLPRIEDEWGGSSVAAAAAGGDSTARGAEGFAAEPEAGGEVRGILGQVRGELELLQQSFLQEKRREWARSLQQDLSTVETTSELLLKRLNEKEKQLRGVLEAFTLRFGIECDEVRARLHHQTGQLQETLRRLRMHKAAIDPTVLLNYYRDEGRQVEQLCASDVPKEYRQLPFSRKSVLQHAAQVTEEICGLIAELGANVKEADGTLFERLQRQQKSKARFSVASPRPLKTSSIDEHRTLSDDDAHSHRGVEKSRQSNE